MKRRDKYTIFVCASKGHSWRNEIVTLSDVQVHIFHGEIQRIRSKYSYTIVLSLRRACQRVFKLYDKKLLLFFFFIRLV